MQNSDTLSTPRPALTYSCFRDCLTEIGNRSSKSQKNHYRGSILYLLTNNLKVIQECFLESWRKRRHLNAIKFSNKARSRAPEHIAWKTFENYNGTRRLKRSFLMQFEKNIRTILTFDHNRFPSHQHPTHRSRLSINSEIALNLLEPCKKMELTDH